MLGVEVGVVVPPGGGGGDIGADVRHVVTSDSLHFYSSQSIPIIWLWRSKPWMPQAAIWVACVEGFDMEAPCVHVRVHTKSSLSLATAHPLPTG